MKRQDVWIVSNYEAIQWMRNPTPINKMETFNAWKTCEAPIPLDKQACNIPRYRGQPKKKDGERNKGKVRHVC